MSTNNSVSEAKLKLTSDISGAKAATQALKEYQATLNTANGANVKLAVTTLELTNRLEEISRAADVKNLGTRFGEMAISVDTSKKAVIELTNELEKLGATKNEIRAAADAFLEAQKAASALNETQAGGGASRTSLVGSRRLLSTVGSVISPLSPEAATGLRVGGDILEVTKDLPKLTEVITGLSPVSIAAAAGIAGLTVAVIALNSSSADNTAGLRQVTARTKDYYQLLVDGTTQAIQAKVKEAEIEQKIAQARVNDLKYLEQGYKETAQQTGVFTGAIVELGGIVGIKQLKDIRDAKGAYEEAQTALKKANDNLGLYNGLIDSNAGATEDAATALKKFNDALGAEIVKGVEVPLEKAKETNDFLAKANSEQLADKRKAAQDELSLTQQEIIQLEEKQKAQDKESQAYKDIDTELKRLGDTEFAQLNAIVLLNDATADAAAKENDLKEVRKQSVDATKKYDEALVKNQATLNEALANAQTKYNDNFVKIAEQGAQAAEAAYEKLKQKQADLLTSFGQTEMDARQKEQYQQLDDQVKFAEQQAKNAREHARNLLKIQKDEAEKEQDLILARDFAGLYALQRDKTRRINEENEAYQQQQQDQLDAFNQQEAANLVHFQREEEQRQTNYQRQIAAAQLAYNREQAQNDKNTRLAYQKAYDALVSEQNLAQAKYTNQLTMLNQSITAELQLIAAGNAAKLALEAQYYAQSQSLIAGIYGNSSSSSYGGNNGNATPTQNIAGGSSIDIPRAFNSSRSGNVQNNNSKNLSVVIEQHITGGADSTRIAKIAAEQAKLAIKELVT